MRKVLILFAVVSVVSIGIGYYMYTMPPQNLTNVKPEAVVSAEELMSLYEDDEDAANKAYLGKVIEVRGKITETKMNGDGTKQIMLESSSMMGGISCNLDVEDAQKIYSALQVGQIVDIKGKCTGYLMDVVLERCVVANIIE